MFKLKTNVEKLDRCVRAMQSETVILACESTIRRELKAFGAQLSKDWNDDIYMPELRLGWDNRHLKVIVHTKSDDKLYDKLMASKHTAISDIKHIRCEYTIIQVLVNYGIELKIEMNFSCPLPSEDLQTLYNLGKVETHSYTSHNTDTSVVCRI